MKQNIFFLVLARDRIGLNRKIRELNELEVPFLIVCGEKVDTQNTVYRKPIGKYDAINFGFESIDTDKIICLNDVDTSIHGFDEALELLEKEDADVVFCKVLVKEGPQPFFYRFLDNIRRILPVAASGELMLIKPTLLKRMIPLKPCKAEDTYILFKSLELGYKTVFCETCWVETERTKTLIGESNYKKRTVSGIYQALSYTNPPFFIRFFYLLLPFLTPLLLLSGEKGFYWMKGIINGVANFSSGVISKRQEGIF